MHTTYHSNCLMSSGIAFPTTILFNIKLCNDLGMSTKEDHLRNRAARFIGRHRRRGFAARPDYVGVCRRYNPVQIATSTIRAYNAWPAR